MTRGGKSSPKPTTQSQTQILSATADTTTTARQNCITSTAGYYDPETGRFINADEPTMLYYTAGTNGGANLFAYCLNNPVMYTDPEGYFIISLTVFLTSLFYVAATAAVVGGIIYLEAEYQLFSHGLELLWNAGVDLVAWIGSLFVAEQAYTIVDQYINADILYKKGEIDLTRKVEDVLK